VASEAARGGKQTKPCKRSHRAADEDEDEDDDRCAKP